MRSPDHHTHAHFTHQVKEIAAEFYDDLPHHTSWCWVMYKFVTDPAIGPFARVKRTHKPIDVDTKRE